MTLIALRYVLRALAALYTFLDYWALAWPSSPNLGRGLLGVTIAARFETQHTKQREKCRLAAGICETQVGSAHIRN